MKLAEIVKKLELGNITTIINGEGEILGGYTSDLLSDVIANSKKGYIWVTMQTHLNIVAVATLKELAAIIIVMNKEPDKDTLEKAENEKVTILKTSMTAFQISGKLYELGIR